MAPAEKPANDIHPKLLEFPQRIKFARQFYGWTQAELAERSGVEQPSISRYERGERLSRISADTLLRLSAALRVSLIWLATGEGSVFGSDGPTIKVEQPSKSV